MIKPVVLLDANIFPAVWLLDVMLTLDEEQVIDAVVRSKGNPPRTMSEELEHLRKLRLDGFVDGMEAEYLQ